MSKTLDEINEMLEAQKKIINILHPLSDRAKRRVLGYFADLVSDPDAESLGNEVDILKQVQEVLGVEEVLKF